MSLFPKVADASDNDVLSIVLIGPDEQRRQTVAGVLAECMAASAGGPQRQALAAGMAIREFSSYSAGLDDLLQMLEQHCDVVMVDLDGDTEFALDVVERLSALDSATLMVYSTQTDRELVVRSMRAGAREFLTLPIVPADMDDALARISGRNPASGPVKGIGRRLFVFLGAKGGCGVTTLASNFAVLLAQESGQTTLLIDLGLPLGDAAINLGMVNEYSTVNALEDTSRLDTSFLSSLLARHSSGLYLLAAPREFSPRLIPNEAIDKLLAVARQSFVPHSMGVNEKQIAKALTRPAQWRIPDDFADARRTRNTATPLALKDSPISRAIRQMARTAYGLPVNQSRKKGFHIFG